MGFVVFLLVNAKTLSLGTKVYNGRAHSELPLQEAQLGLWCTGDLSIYFQ